MLHFWQLLASICLGIGLAAACGFRVFIPPLLLGIFYRAEFITLGEKWEWVASDLAILLLIIATLLEISAYLIPWLDNLLDALATPTAIAAGTLITYISIDGNIDPSINVILSLISGIGITGSIQFSTVLIRGLSSVSSGGLGNFIVSTLEFIISILLIISSIFLPVLTIIIVIILIIFMKRIIDRLRKAKRQSNNIKV